MGQNFIARCFFLVFGFALAPLVLAETAAGPDVELICPCTFSSSSSSALRAGYGIVNRGSSASGELVVRLYAHSAIRYEQTGENDLIFLTDIAVADSMAADSTIAPDVTQARIRQPGPGTYYVTMLLLEDNQVIDRALMSDQVTFGTVASSTYADLFFTEDPSATISGGNISVQVPAIGNSGTTTESGLEIFLAGAQSADFFGGSYVVLGEISNGVSISSGTTSSPDTAQFAYDPPAGFDFVHLVVTNGEFTLLTHVVESPGVTFSQGSYAVTGMDFLIDTDGDGVADDNEKLMGSDPESATSKPADSTIDVLVVYSTGVTSFYNGDPSARIEHLIEYANQALADSEVDITLRLAGSEELAMDTSQNISQWLEAAENGDGVFSDLQQRRDDTGADLVVMFRLYDGANTCGLATLGGFASQGLMQRGAYISASFIEFDECQDNTMIHEIGHNMGLGHSYKQGETGTFEWSRGYGENSNFATIMAYGSEFDVFPELPYFSNPDIALCEGSACGRDIDQSAPAHAAKSLNAVRFQVAAFNASSADDADADGVPDTEDAFPNDASEFEDTDADGLGDNADYDDDNDGMPDIWEVARGHDPAVNDADADDDNDGITNLEEYQGTPRATQYLQTNSVSSNITRLHIVNTSGQSQSFTGTLFSGSGAQLGAAYVSLGAQLEPNERMVLTSADLEDRFGISAWAGPAMLEVTGEGSFELMAKLASPSGLVSNTNCVRDTRVLNIEGFDSSNMTFVRFINTGDNLIGPVNGTLYNTDGQVIGNADTELLASLAPKAQVWINRNNLASLVSTEWDGEAMLEVGDVEDLKLLNLNFVNNETFFNFSCFEDSTSATVYLQTTSTSANTSLTHIVNTSDVPQQFSGTLYVASGAQQGVADGLLHEGTIAPRGRVILSSADIEERLGVSAWSGPAMLVVSGSDTFELMTKLQSPSGLISNTNCVRQGEVHNIEGFDSPDMTFVRLINTGDSTLENITGTLFGSDGGQIGLADQTLRSELAPRQQVWLNRNNLSDIFDNTWQGEALLEVNGGDALRLLNLNYINSETFFNFSCYEASN